MLRLSAAVLASTMLAGCATQAPPLSNLAPPPAVAEAAPAAAVPLAPAAPRPQYGTYGFDAAGMDRSVAPGDDFYNYANGTWAKNTPIPADKAAYGMFNVLDELSKQRTRDLIEQQAKQPDNRIGAVYNSFMDTAAIESKGLKPFDPWLNQVRGVNSKAGLAALYARADKLNIPVPFAMGISQDSKAPDQYVLEMVQAGIGMPDREYYLSKDPKLTETRAQYLTHLATMLKLAGESNSDARAKAILALETNIAKAHWTPAESRDATKTYNKMTVAALKARAPGFDFRSLFTDEGANVDSLVVDQPSAISGIARALNSAPLQVLKDQLVVRSLERYAAALPKAIDDENFHFHGTVLTGVPQQRDRWKRGVDFTVGALGDDVSRLYVDKYFPPETKAAADKLVHNIIAAMDRRIDQLDWMSAETKVKAHAKLAAFTPKIGYPSQWRDMSGLHVDPTDALGNAMRSAEFENAYELGKLGKPIYRWEWGMTPMTINAYANFGMVEIVFPAAILQPPFFDPNADPAVNYGGIGAVIGHELSHHFDDQGAKYDLTGKLVDWWSPRDVAAFKSRLDKLEAEYNAYEPLPGLHINGKLTMGENVADLAGLTVAHDAYMASLNGAPPPVIDGMTADQRFYLGWAQVWRTKYREPILRQLTLTNPHSPGQYRADIVRNMDPWYSAFGAQPGQKLYLAPDGRVRIW